jgi:LPPG:FO 2-phospho-L-lactate transferase
MITVLSGGSESLKLIRSMRHFLDDDEIAVIANTSDALWMGGTLASPDIDDLIFLFSGILNTTKWHGIKGDTYSTCLFFRKYFEDEITGVGDKERAVHIARGRYLSEGISSTQVTKEICQRFGICSAILPATDNFMGLRCKVGDEMISTQNLRQRFSGNELDIIGSIDLEYYNEPVLTKEASSAIRESDAVIIGPGSPMTSVLPIIACRGIRNLLLENFTIAFAPPFPKNDSGLALSNYNKIFRIYKDLSELLVQDSLEEDRIEGAMLLNTKMTSRHSAESLAWDLMSVIRSHGKQTA